MKVITKRTLMSFYKRSMQQRRLKSLYQMHGIRSGAAASGLCSSLRGDYGSFLLQIFYPTQKDKIKYRVNSGWWLSGDNLAHDFEFTELRQTVICFLMTFSVKEKREFIKWLNDVYVYS